jgi:predicted TIM-barrel fold metal-dependent hydrolase
VRIDVEAHYLDARFIELLRSRSEPPREEVVDGAVRMYVEPSAPDVFQGRSAGLGDALVDVGEARLAVLDAAGVDVQLLSMNLPGCEQFAPQEGAALAREQNGRLAELIAPNPHRFVGLATLCPDPEAPEVAADELERCVLELGFRGWKVNSHVRDGYLDDRRYRPIFERAAALGVPIFLHPAMPHGSMIRPYTGYGFQLPGPSLGFAAETALQAMRLVYSGLFDDLPELQIVLGHLGEGLYFWLYRLDFEFTKPWLARDPRIACEAPPSEYLRTNFWAAATGHLQDSAFAATYAELGAGRMLFGTDYPYESVDDTIAWLERQSLTPEERNAIFSANAASLFGIDQASTGASASAPETAADPAR